MKRNGVVPTYSSGEEKPNPEIHWEENCDKVPKDIREETVNGYYIWELDCFPLLKGKDVAAKAHKSP